MYNLKYEEMMNDILKQEELVAPERQQSEKETYLPPTLEVIEVKTEQGYALSGKTSSWKSTPW